MKFLNALTLALMILVSSKALADSEAKGRPIERLPANSVITLTRPVVIPAYAREVHLSPCLIQIERASYQDRILAGNVLVERVEGGKYEANSGGPLWKTIIYLKRENGEAMGARLHCHTAYELTTDYWTRISDGLITIKVSDPIEF